jgi:3-oxoacyl-[acyl-carrier-protein] synthase II
MTDPSSRRVVVTGIGLVSPLGITPATLWEGLTSGKSGISKLSLIPTDHLPVRCGGEIRDFTGHIDNFGSLEGTVKRTIRKGLKVMCREIQMGVAAAQMALCDAGLSDAEFDHDRTGVVYGCDYIMTLPDEFTEGVRNCLDEDGQFQFGRWAEDGLPKVTPLWLLKYLPNMPASHIAIYNDLRGPNNSLTLREASANLAMAEAYSTMSRGSADCIVTGATGTRLHPLKTVHVILQEELATGDDPATLSRPFERDRSGAVLSEGAGTIVLEELTSAQSRGVKIRGEVIGYGSSSALDRRGVSQLGVALENVLRQALSTSGLEPAQIGHVHAHGLSTRRSDAEEGQAIRRIFGEQAPSVPVVAAKSHIGNLGAGGGMVETIASLLALEAGHLFPILNYDNPGPDCPISAATAATPAGDNFININVSPQGQASAIVFRRWEE